MNKILIKGYFKNSDTNDVINYNDTGFIMNNTIKFKHDNTDIKIKYINNNLCFIKEDEKSILKTSFLLKQNTISEYYIKQDDLKVEIPIYTNKIIYKNNIVEIEYDLLIDDKNKIKNILHIEYEVLE